MEGKLLTIEQLANFLGVCDRTARRIVSKKSQKKLDKITIEVVNFTKRTVRYIVTVTES